MPVAVTKHDIASPGAYTNKSELTQELLKRDNSQTPDYLQLKLRREHILFVYGTLKSGGPLHSVLEDYPSLGDGYTATRNWVMRSVQGKFPVVMPSQLGQESSAGKIYGEVFIVPPELILDLDQIEANGVMYERSYHWIWLQDQSFKTKGGTARPSVKAWMYVGRPSWVYQQSTTICIRKESGADKAPYYDKYFEWDNQQGTQLSAMQGIWAKYGMHDLANDRLPF